MLTLRRQNHGAMSQEERMEAIGRSSVRSKMWACGCKCCTTALASIELLRWDGTPGEAAVMDRLEKDIAKLDDGVAVDEVGVTKAEMDALFGRDASLSEEELSRSYKKLAEQIERERQAAYVAQPVAVTAMRPTTATEGAMGGSGLLVSNDWAYDWADFGMDEMEKTVADVLVDGEDPERFDGLA
jgi:hypothetical protein